MSMTVTEHLLTIVAEECAEVAQRCSKALRFGLDETRRGRDLNNAGMIMEEFDDLLAVVKMLQSEGSLPSSDKKRVKAKIKKVKKYLEYSGEVGTLSK